MLIFLAGWAALMVSAARAESFTLVADDHPPYIDKQAPNGGAAVAAVRALFATAGLGDVRYVQAPWLRAYQMVREGEADLSVPFRWTPQRAQEVLYGPVVLVDRPNLYVADPSRLTATTVAGLAGLSLCSPLGYALDANLTDMIAQGRLSVQSPPSEGLCLEMLREGRADLMLTTPMRLAGLTASPPRSEGLRPLPIYLEPAPLHLILSRRRPDVETLHAQLTAAAARLGLPDRFGGFFPHTAP